MVAEELQQQNQVKINRYYTQSLAKKDNVKTVYDLFEYKKETCIIKDNDSQYTENIEVPRGWSADAATILANHYCRKQDVPLMVDNEGRIKYGNETSIKQVVHRIVNCWQVWGKREGLFSDEDSQIFYDEMVYMMLDQIAAPNSPTWYNSGLFETYGITGEAVGHWYVDPQTGLPVESDSTWKRPCNMACFLLGLKDSMFGENGIYDNITTEARVFKLGGGTGMNISSLRAKGEALSGGGSSSGPMEFGEIFDRNANCVKSGGRVRRAAKMVIMDIDHPDIEEFINIKMVEEKKARALIDAGYDSNMNGEAYGTVGWQNGNNSVRISNSFFNTMLNNEDWKLRGRVDASKDKLVSSTKLWDAIAEAAWACADPGLQFSTTINDWNTCANDGEIVCSNPCGEALALPNTCCNLASLNLVKFLAYKDDGMEFNVKAFTHAIKFWTMALEITVYMAQLPSKSLAIGTYNYRNLGLGYLNVGSLLMRLGLPYDSDQGRAIIATITSLLTGMAYLTSSEMAAMVGPYCRFEANKNAIMKVVKNHRAILNYEPTQELSIVNNSVNYDNTMFPNVLTTSRRIWDQVITSGEKWGFRNAQVTAIAPTGTISFVLGADTTGIEPEFSLVRYKKLVGGGMMRLVNDSVKITLERLGYSESQVADIIQYVIGSGNIDNAPFVNRQTLLSIGLSEDIINQIQTNMVATGSFKSALNNLIIDQQIKAKLNIKSPVEIIDYLRLADDQILAIDKYVCGSETIEGAPHITNEHLAIFDCAVSKYPYGVRYIRPLGHIKMMAAVQPFVSGAISKTCNMPSECTVNDIKDIYFESWKLGLKGIAVYRDKCKACQPLSTSSSNNKVKTTQDNTVVEESEGRGVRIPLPNRRASVTRKGRIDDRNLFVTIGLYPDGTFGEVFANFGGEGGTSQQLLSAWCEAVSLLRQCGYPTTEIIRQFRAKPMDTGFEPNGLVFGDDHIKTCKSPIDYITNCIALECLRDDSGSTIKLSEKDLPELIVPRLNGISEHWEGGVEDHYERCPKCGLKKLKIGRCSDQCVACGEYINRGCA